VVLAMPGTQSALRSDAEAFAGRAKAIRDKAMIDARATSIRVTALGYAFDERARGGWKPTNGDVTQGLLWREGTQAAIPPGETVRIVFDSTGVAEPARLTLQRGGQQISVTIAYDGKIDVAA
jgi:general secretion pathway protein H